MFELAGVGSWCCEVLLT